MNEVSPDFFQAYGLVLNKCNTEQLLENTLEHLRKTKRTFELVTEAIFSDRHPATIIGIASKAGLYIPPRKRIGVKAYEFFINNIKYYEEVLERDDPNVYEIVLARDSLEFLMKFKDHQILRSGCIFSRNYDDRKVMLEKFIKDNILPYGKFILDIHSRKVYDSKAKSILYMDANNTKHYSVEELLSHIDLNNNVMWKSQDETFTLISLLHLRQQILEKLGQWKQRDGQSQTYIAPALHQLLYQLETLLHHQPKNEISAYLGHPTFA